MSLTDWVEWDLYLFNALFEKPKIKMTGEIKAPPLTTHYGTIGIAFDYVLRFVITKHNSELVKRRGLMDSAAGLGVNIDSDIGCDQLNFVSDAENRISRYLSGKLEITDLYNDCLSLAKIESQYRSGYNLPNDEIFTNNPDDICDLHNLTSAINIDDFTAKDCCVLNPTFGDSSKDIGGADADLLIDDTLIDIKTTKHLVFEKEYFRQLMGYYILNIREGEILGQINKLGIYFSRYGKMLEFDIPECRLENKYNDISLEERSNMSNDEKIDYMMYLFEDSINEYHHS